MTNLPKIISGTSTLGNLYQELSHERKKEIINEYIIASSSPAVFDSAGKYGAGLALETLSSCLNELGIAPEDVIISNKLGWLRKPLTTPEPTFEPGIWKNLKYDAVQRISYQGIIDCFEEGNKLLGKYKPQLLSVHDPDEYLAAATDAEDENKRYADIMEAYRALSDLKTKGLIKAIGIGAKNWKVIERISRDVKLDWVMFANSMTIYHHPTELLDFIERLRLDNIAIINSALFHGGFLMGNDFYNYKPVSRDNTGDKMLYKWRDDFYTVCEEFDVSPAAACVYFGLHIPGIKSVALNSSSPERVKQNVALGEVIIPPTFWERMKERKLIDADYPYL